MELIDMRVWIRVERLHDDRELMCSDSECTIYEFNRTQTDQIKYQLSTSGEKETKKWGEAKDDGE